MKPSIRLFGTKILVGLTVEENKETKTEGGIIIPASVNSNSEKARTKWAEVKLVGNEVKNIKEGDVVLYDMYSATGIHVDGVDYIIVREEDLVAART